MKTFFALLGRFSSNQYNIYGDESSVKLDFDGFKSNESKNWQKGWILMAYVDRRSLKMILAGYGRRRMFELILHQTHPLNRRTGRKVGFDGICGSPEFQDDSRRMWPEKDV